MGLDRTAECTNCGTLMVQGGNSEFPTDMVCGNCGTDHDMNGRPLARRGQWGDETGEVFY
jgi:transcription elongation factor Elf1